jgi:predicted  nucleic acid-binding Zn-ribbon protein
MFNRENIAKFADEVARHATLVENVKSLQEQQKVLADALSQLGDRIRNLEADMKVIKAEVKFEALKETQLIVNAVQGNLNERIERLTLHVSRIVSPLPNNEAQPDVLNQRREITLIEDGR